MAFVTDEMRDSLSNLDRDDSTLLRSSRKNMLDF